jgi:hypothetical protein
VNTEVTTVTWELLVSAEQDLLRLEAEALWMAKHAGLHPCANEIWYRFLKPQLLKMIGHGRGYPRGVPAYEPAGGWPDDNPLHGVCLGDPEVVAHYELVKASRYPATTADEKMLRGSDAYDTAYDHLYELLPDCEHEGMCRG